MPENPDLPLFVERLTGAQSALYGCIRSLMGGSPEAADVLQEANRALWQKAAEYDPSRPFLPWAYRVAQFQVLAHRKRQSRDRLVFDEELIGQLTDDLIGQAASGDRELRALAQCLEKLPGAQRELIAAKYERGEALDVVAARLEKPVNAVSAMLYRIRRALAECIERALSAPDPV